MTIGVLIVDDNRLIRKILRDTVSQDRAFCVLHEAENGLQALQLYERHRPGVVIMDIVMPEMDGIEALKRILDIDPCAAVIMVSSPGQEALVMEAIVAGAKAFLLKPIQPASLLHSIRSILGLKPEIVHSA